MMGISLLMMEVGTQTPRTKDGNVESPTKRMERDITRKKQIQADGVNNC